MSNVTPLRTRRPTGRPGWPRILLTGGEGTWKSGTAAKLSARDDLGTMFWLEIGMGEQTADEYGALPGVDYEILDHDGTWVDMMAQLEAAWHAAKAAEDAGELPRPLTIDSMTGVDIMLKDMGGDRARKKAAQQLARKGCDSTVPWSADYDPQMTPDLWNLIRKRHRQLMRLVLTWPAPVVLTARERVATVFDGEKPTGQKDWTLEARKDLPFDVTAWFRLHGHGRAEVMKLRSAKSPQKVDLDDPNPRVSDFDLGTVVFDWIGCESGVSRAARTIVPDADQDMPDEVDQVAPQQPSGGDRPTGGGRQYERPSQQPKPPTPEEIADYSGKLLVLADAAKAKQLQAWFEHSDRPASVRDAVAVLTDDDREVLGIQADAPITLYGLSVTVAEYVGKHNRSVRMPLDVDHPAGETKAA